MFGLWSEDQKAGNDDNVTGRVKLKLMKSRHGGTNTTATLQFAKQCLAMVPMEEPTFVKQAVRELDFVVNGDNFDRVMYRHATGDDSFPMREADFERWMASVPTVKGTTPDTIDVEEDDANDHGTLEV